MEIKQEILEASWQEHFSDEPELAMFISFEAGFIAGLECQQAALVAALRDLLAWANIQDFHSPQAVAIRDAARAALAGVEGGAE